MKIAVSFKPFCFLKIDNLLNLSQKRGEKRKQDSVFVLTVFHLLSTFISLTFLLLILFLYLNPYSLSDCSFQKVNLNFNFSRQQQMTESYDLGPVTSDAALLVLCFFLALAINILFFFIRESILNFLKSSVVDIEDLAIISLLFNGSGPLFSKLFFPFISCKLFFINKR